jgi:hypothetical protein
MRKLLLLFVLLLTPFNASAQSVGAACTPNGAAAWISGIPLVCSSLVWAVDTVRVGSSSATCSGSIQGAMRMNSTTLEYCNGTAWTALVGGVAGSSNIDVQTFSASGTWTRPSTGAYVLVECWGGGAGGGRGNATGNFCHGGGGGGYNYRWVLRSSLAATETVTIGAGGAGGASAGTSGSAGGNTTFGSWVTAYGGVNTGSAFGGGMLSTVGSPAIVGLYNHGFYLEPSLFYGGGGSTSSGSAGGASLWGGGGGGNGCTSTNGTGTAGGASQYAGNGGAGGFGTTTGTAGTQPGGGGGGTYNGSSAGAGAAGRCRVTTF